MDEAGLKSLNDTLLALWEMRIRAERRAAETDARIDDLRQKVETLTVLMDQLLP